MKRGAERGDARAVAGTLGHGLCAPRPGTGTAYVVERRRALDLNLARAFERVLVETGATSDLYRGLGEFHFTLGFLHSVYRGPTPRDAGAIGRDPDRLARVTIMLSGLLGYGLSIAYWPPRQNGRRLGQFTIRRSG